MEIIGRYFLSSVLCSCMVCVLTFNTLAQDARKAIPRQKIDSVIFYEYHPEDNALNIYNSTELLPDFPSSWGKNGINKFLKDSLRYPLDEREREVGGRVIVSIVIERDGSLSNIKVVKSISPALDAEAIRLFKSMPKFSPAMQDDVKVRFHFLIPLNFALVDD
jgi:TonB family protein